MSYLSYGGILRHETDPTVVQTLIGKGWELSPMPAVANDQRADWVAGQWVVIEIQDTIPKEVPMWALKEVCVSRNHTAQIDAALAGLPEPPRVKAMLRWEYKDTISRGSSMIALMQTRLDWSNAYVDELFIAADTLAKS